MRPFLIHTPGAIEWKDDFSTGKPVYKPTGSLEPMWTMANHTNPGPINLHEAYISAFDEAAENIRMALIAPQEFNGTEGKWYGVGGASLLAETLIPTIGCVLRDFLCVVRGSWADFV